MKRFYSPSPVRGSIPLDKYGGEWIAILSRQIVDHDRSLERLWKRLERKGMEEKALFMLVPRPGASPV
jgi:hypothetical protein